jgi:hypothetical protein
VLDPGAVQDDVVVRAAQRPGKPREHERQPPFGEAVHEADALRRQLLVGQRRSLAALGVMAHLDQMAPVVGARAQHLAGRPHRHAHVGARHRHAPGQRARGQLGEPGEAAVPVLQQRPRRHAVVVEQPAQVVGGLVDDERGKRSRGTPERGELERP